MHDGRQRIETGANLLSSNCKRRPLSPTNLRRVAAIIAPRGQNGSVTPPRGWWKQWALERLTSGSLADRAPTIHSVSCPELPAIEILLRVNVREERQEFSQRQAQAMLLTLLERGSVQPESIIVHPASCQLAAPLAGIARLLGLRFFGIASLGDDDVVLDSVQAAGGAIIHICETVDPHAAARQISSAVNALPTTDPERLAFAVERLGAERIVSEITQACNSSKSGELSWLVMGCVSLAEASQMLRRALLPLPPRSLPQLCFVAVDDSGSRFAETDCPGDVQLHVSAAGALAGARWIEQRLGVNVGAQIGAGALGTLITADAMRRRSCPGAIVILDDSWRFRCSSETNVAVTNRSSRAEVEAWSELIGLLGTDAFPKFL